jgi:hypothetical protein
MKVGASHTPSLTPPPHCDLTVAAASSEADILILQAAALAPVRSKSVNGI